MMPSRILCAILLVSVPVSSARTRADRERAKDSRASIEERYQRREEYLTRASTLAPDAAR
jgi:hypothetical protein